MSRNGMDPFSFLEAVDDFGRKDREAVSLATVTSLHADGCRVEFDGEGSSTLKRYRYVSADGPEVGARVAMLRVGSSYVILGTVRTEDSGWSQPVFYSGWSNYGVNTSWPSLQYKVIGDLCYVKGMVTRSNTSATIAWDFPRPMHNSIHIVANEETPFYVEFEKRAGDGRLVLRPGTAVSARMSLGMLVYQLA